MNSLETSVKEFQKYVKPLIIKDSLGNYIYHKSNKGKNLPILAIAQIS
jgi:hypothetical protein